VAAVSAIGILSVSAGHCGDVCVLCGSTTVGGVSSEADMSFKRWV
jgi:hypothetical protein